MKPGPPVDSRGRHLFTLLNLFIAIIVNAMQTFSQDERQDTVSAVKKAREHIEADLRAEVHAPRGEIAG